MAPDERPRCQIYLVAAPGLDPAMLDMALAAGDIACVLLRRDAAGEESLRASIDTLRSVAHQHAVAFLIQDHPALAKETGCDGVHLSGNGEAMAAARRALGADAIVGETCGPSRHAAIVAGESGVDYVAFGGFGGGPAGEVPPDAADPELVSWWQAMMTISCVAVGSDDLESARAMARAGADFVAVSRAVWDHPEGPATAVRALASELAAAIE
jgi:thiamine-phosphate pyrophosphorylase